jgi:hypothetical protein
MNESVFKYRTKRKPTPLNNDAKVDALIVKISQLEKDLAVQKVNHNNFVKKMKYLDSRVGSNENKINFINSTIATMKQTVNKLAGIFR